MAGDEFQEATHEVRAALQRILENWRSEPVDLKPVKPRLRAFVKESFTGSGGISTG